MPEFNPPLPQFSIPPPGYSLPPELARRQYLKPIEPAPKPAHHPSVYQRAPPPADYHRSASPPHRPYRWPPPGPSDEPARPPPHSDYRRDSWDYRFREPAAGPPPSFPPGRPPSPFREWSRPPPPPQGWSPRRGSDSEWGSRRDWDEREGGSSYGPSHGWDRPPSPPPRDRDWQGDPYARRPLPPVDQPRGSPPLAHEPGWGREPVPHYDQYDRDMHEDWIRPDDWTEGDEMNPHMYSNPAQYGSSGRPRGRSFMQDRRPPPPSGSSYSSVQPSPRGPGPIPLDNPSRRHSQHDRRYSGPGYSGDARGYHSNNTPRRQFQPGRGSFNDSNRAKLVPRDQLLVANTSIKVEDPDGHALITPNPASASSASPEKSISTGKRSRTDSVAAEAEPASRRPSPFTSSTPTVVDPASAITESAPDTRLTPNTSKEQPTLSNAGSSTNLQSQTNGRMPAETPSTQAEQIGGEQVDSTDPGGHRDSSVLSQTGTSKALVDETTGVDPPTKTTDTARDSAANEAMDSEPSAAVSLQAPELGAADANPNEPAAAPSASADVSVDGPSSDADLQESQLPLLQFEYLGFSDDEEEHLPPTSIREALPLRSLDLNKLATNVEDVLQNNLKLASHRQPIMAASGDIPTLEIFSMPDEETRVEFRNLLRGEFSEREDYVEAKLGGLEEEYLTLNETWSEYCLRLDEAAEKRRVREAAAAAAAAQNVVSEPVAAQTRSTRRNPVVNTGVMADAVHSDFEMEKVMSNMRDAAAVDPDLLARPNLARIPDMVTVTEPEMLRFTFDDENGQVDDPIEFYDFKGRTVDHWTTEERDIFIDQHRVFNKRFDKIAEHLPHKTTSQCVKYYYLMKKVPAFRAQVKRGQRRRLGRGGHQGKASALMADIEKEEDGTIASPREDESIATRRSRRHAATANTSAAQSSTPPPSTTIEASKPRRPRVVELARADSFDTDRAGTSTPMSFASDSEAGGDVPHPSDLDLLLSTQPQRKGGPGRGRRWAYKGEVPNGNGGSVRLDGAEPSKKRPATTSYWTVAERTALKQNLLRHGRDWNRIAAVIQSKTSIQAKNYYFNNQKEMSVYVRAWEKEQNKEGKASYQDSASGNAAEAGPSASASPAPAVKKEEPKRSTGPVTIQPAPGQTAPFSMSNPPRTPKASGRGNAHYPNVIPQSALPQHQAWAKNNIPLKTKPPVAAPSQTSIIPTPPLPLPGPTFRAWPVSSAPPPPPMTYAFGSFPGAPGPGTMKPGGSAGAPAAGSTSAPTPGAPRPSGAPASAGVAGSSSSGTGGVQRGNLNHYPGPMRYQPYPVTATNIGGSIGGMSKGKAPPSRSGFPLKSSAPTMQPTPPGMGMSRAGVQARPGAVLGRSSSGQFASWNGEGKGKKPM